MKVNFIDTEIIMSVVVALIILAVGVFAFFITMESIPIANTGPREPIQNIASNQNSIFNILGVVLIVGVMLLIINLVYGFTTNTERHDSGKPTQSNQHQKNITESTKIKHKSKTKKDSFEWGN